MINPNEINFVTLNCFVPSSFFSGSLIQLVTFLQNLNLKALMSEAFERFCSVLLNWPARVSELLSSLKSIGYKDLLSQKRDEYKKDFHSW
jgi:hypothetical protein